MAELNFERALDVLAGTPPVLSAIVTNLPRSAQDERPSEGAWSPREVLAHLLHAETASMGPRVKRAAEQDHLPYEQGPPQPAPGDPRQMSNDWADARARSSRCCRPTCTPTSGRSRRSTRRRPSYRV